MISSKHFPITISVSVAILAVAVGAISILSLINSFKYGGYDKKDFIDSTSYQAIFLDNNQIYFGHLHETHSDYPVLSDVYYIQLTQESSKKGEPAQDKGRLIRLGDSEPHRPQNEMILNKEHILFWENLKANSPVVKTIQNLNAQNK